MEGGEIKMNALKKLTDTWTKILAFKVKHKKIFEKLDKLEKEYQLALQELQNYIKETQQDVENEVFKVLYTKAYKRWYDYDTIAKIATPAEMAIISERCLKKEINTQEFNKLIEEGILPAVLAQKSYREQELTPRVIIRKKYERTQKQEGDNNSNRA
jgi:hypothetical protein